MDTLQIETSQAKKDEIADNQAAIAREMEFYEAVVRVYNEYGADFSAFFRDAERDALKCHDSQKGGRARV